MLPWRQRSQLLRSFLPVELNSAEPVNRCSRNSPSTNSLRTGFGKAAIVRPWSLHQDDHVWPSCGKQEKVGCGGAATEPDLEPPVGGSPSPLCCCTPLGDPIARRSRKSTACEPLLPLCSRNSPPSPVNNSKLVKLPSRVCHHVIDPNYLFKTYLRDGALSCTLNAGLGLHLSYGARLRSPCRLCRKSETSLNTPAANYRLLNQRLE